MLNCKKAINKECLVLADKSDFFYQIYSKTASKPDSKRLIKVSFHALAANMYSRVPYTVGASGEFYPLLSFRLYFNASLKVLKDIRA